MSRVASFLALGVALGVAGGGCAAARTSPKTVKLETLVEAAPTTAGRGHSVLVRFPSGFRNEEARLLMAAKMELMLTKTTKKGKPRPDPMVQHFFDPGEAVLKSMAAALQLRDALGTNGPDHVLLIPCQLVATNGELVLEPSVHVPVHHLAIDINILNVVHTSQGAPWYKWQGCNMSRYLAPMVRMTVPSAGGELLVAGTRRWMTPDGRMAMVLPEVLERRFTGYTYGVHMNFRIVKPAKDGAPEASTVRPAKRTGFHEFDSFVEGSKQSADFRPYWARVAAVAKEILAATPPEEEELGPLYGASLGIGAVEPGRLPLARKFMEAEWRFVQASDHALVAKLAEAKWFEGMDELRKSEDLLLKKAKRQHFWNQFAMMATSMAGGAAMGAGTAMSASSGVAYNATPTAMMTMAAVQSIGAAGAADQIRSLDLYKTVTAKTQLSASAVALGLSEESAGVTFTTVEQVRDLARAKLNLQRASP